MEPKIIFEDDCLMVLNKPTGWIVNEASTTGEISVVQCWLKENFNYETSSLEKERSGIVHRLDKETSGLLLIGKTKEAFSSLQRQFKERLVKKEYLALVHGKVTPESGEINARVGRLPWRRDRFGILPGGREAKTRYLVESLVYKGKGKNQEYFSLLKLFPETGRTHQIRIHLKHLGHPVVSDTFYAGRKTARKDRTWCPRLFLHASAIECQHPITNKKLGFTLGLPLELKRIFNLLQKQV